MISMLKKIPPFLLLLFSLFLPLAAMGDNEANEAKSGETQNNPNRWVLMSEHPKNDYATYIDPSSIQADGNNAHLKRVDILLEEKIKKPQNTQQSVTSIVVGTTINCNNQTGQVNELRFYAQPQATGTPKHTNTTTKKDFFPYNPKDEGDVKLLDAVCKNNPK